ncbi:DUF1499 domain-containing protein [Agrobacterium tumefaciens]|uniref:DUF1499 domain-containing protein n=1 Tax=Agrobacterium tumefaciens TaxID=358 RepID=UPI00287E899F|nr:DUF1499 domain-containing protein [Agrobacterium tumefaciens]MDS7596402.1 DUF1499 domain-containing protein [Agrobacterium tumefaciens]
MTVRFVRPVSFAAYLSRYLGFAALALFLIAVGLHRFGPLTTPDLVGLLLISAGIAALAVLLALIGLERLWTKGSRGGLWALSALIFSGLPLGVVGYGAFLYWQQPKIYDVSTDLTETPEWLVPPVANQQWLVRPTVLAAEDRAAQSKAYASLAGRRYEGAIDRIYAAAKKTASAQKIRITHTRGVIGAPTEPSIGVPEQDRTPPTEDTPLDDLPSTVPVPLARPADAPLPAYFSGNGIVSMQGETRTLVWGLRFDILIRLKEEAETTVVDIRVASRYGPHDLGMGADIAEAFLDALDAEMQGLNDS